MKEQSLHQIMNKMVARLDTLQIDDAQKQSTAKKLSELEAFMQMDSLLASLNKEYLEAKAQRKNLCQLNGKGDAMAEVAMDMEDSAWCAMQTRYIELRQSREKMERAQHLMRESEKGEAEAVEKQAKADKEKEFNNYIYWSRTVPKMREMNKTPYIFEWAILLLVFKVKPFHYPTNVMNHAHAA